MSTPSTPFPLPRSWSERWRYLARTVALDPAEPVLLALSGGADSTYLLHVLAAARERPSVFAVHVDHGLRGAESARDAAFSAALCRDLGIPFAVRRAELDPEGPSLEARARTARYGILTEEARRAKLSTLITGHHADDNLETLLMRWIRGTSLTGLSALRPRLELAAGSVPGGRRLTIARPLYGLRREEVRELLVTAGLSWCEDSSNRSQRFARNRVRHVLIPEIQRLAGSAGVENLRAFARAVEELEGHLARATAELGWRPLAAAPACRGAGQAELGGTLPRGPLMALSPTQRRRALWRLVLEGTGRAPRRALLDAIQLDLARGRAARHALPAGFALHLRTESLELHPPRRLLETAAPLARGREPCLPFPEPHEPDAPQHGRFLAFGAERAAVLDFSGEVALPDGRALTLEVVRGDGQRDVPRARGEVELDPWVASRPLAVRWPRAGDRFHPLGAPGSRPLRRVLADWGVPRDERARVPLVVAGGAREEIVWVAGVCPAEGARVRPPAAERVRLRLLWAAPEPRRDEGHRQPSAPRGQRSFFGAG